jgi:hypothetical protein
MYTSQVSLKVMCLNLASAGFRGVQIRSRAGVDTLAWPERGCGYSGGNDWRARLMTLHLRIYPLILTFVATAEGGSALQLVPCLVESSQVVLS